MPILGDSPLANVSSKEKVLKLLLLFHFIFFFLQFHRGSLRSLRTKRRFLKWDEEEGGGWRVEGEGWKIEDGG